MTRTLLAREPEAPRFWLPLAVLLLPVIAVYILGGAVTATSVSGWYQTLAKPSFNPPDWLFAPVWAVLFVLMAVAAALAWRAGPRGRRAAMAWFGAQLALNFAWSCVFFGLRAPGPAFFGLLLLWAAIAGTLLTFWRKDRLAGLLLAPYLAWVSYAGVLNFMVWRLN